MSTERHRPRARQLSADEHRLWTAITRAIKPLKPTPVDAPPDLFHAAPRVEEKPAPPAPVVPQARNMAPPPLAPLDRRFRQRLARGTEPIGRRLDLHGCTQREARDALVRFLRGAQADGHKVVLVVTGKGQRDAAGDPFVERGVLRRLVPQWLKAPEFRELVVGFDAAHVGHGGEGALYVRLRRRRH
jgi:DNA-nicking Smr family endonuclease